MEKMPFEQIFLMKNVESFIVLPLSLIKITQDYKFVCFTSHIREQDEKL